MRSIPVWMCGVFVVGALTLPGYVRMGDAQARPDDPLPSPIFSAGEYGVIAPKTTHFVAAKFTDEARRARYQGVCLVNLIVDEHGMPRDVHVIKPLGMGLDKNAMEAVKQERFEPGTYNGKPVAVRLSIEVSFHFAQ